MTTRDEYIKRVKVKLEEISPFDEPQSFIVAGNQTDPNDYADVSTVKPIISYIEESLDEATRDCLNNLPLSLLASDIDDDKECFKIDEHGVGHVDGFDEHMRLVRVASLVWERDVTAFITSSDPLYLLQQNKYTRGKCCKPVVAYVPERQELELYSFPHHGHCDNHCDDHCDCASSHAKVYYIDCRKKAERVQSKIEDFIVLRCAALVLEILKDENASVMMTEYNNKLNDILK